MSEVRYDRDGKPYRWAPVKQSEVSIRQLIEQRGLQNHHNPRQALAEADGVEYRAAVVGTPDDTFEHSAEAEERRSHMEFARQNPPQTRLKLPWKSTFTVKESAQLRALETKSAALIYDLVLKGAAPNLAARSAVSLTAKAYRDEEAAVREWTRFAELVAKKEERAERKGQRGRKSYNERRAAMKAAVKRIEGDNELRSWANGGGGRPFAVTVGGPTSDTPGSVQVHSIRGGARAKGW